MAALARRSIFETSNLSRSQRNGSFGKDSLSFRPILVGALSAQLKWFMVAVCYDRLTSTPAGRNAQIALIQLGQKRRRCDSANTTVHVYRAASRVYGVVLIGSNLGGKR